jgi:hypothetical protein
VGQSTLQNNLKNMAYFCFSSKVQNF